MKYIKIFEKFDVGYEEIDGTEFLNQVIGDGYNKQNINKFQKEKLDSFKKVEIERIMKIFPDASYDNSNRNITWPEGHPYHMFSDDPNIKNGKLLIYKVTEQDYDEDEQDYGPNEDELLTIYKVSDEWYFVEDHTQMNTYYKCDQFDGLIKCLEDNF